MNGSRFTDEHALPWRNKKNDGGLGGNRRCIREHFCPKSRMNKFIFKCASLALNKKLGEGVGGGGRAHV